MAGGGSRPTPQPLAHPVAVPQEPLGVQACEEHSLQTAQMLTKFPSGQNSPLCLPDRGPSSPESTPGLERVGGQQFPQRSQAPAPELQSRLLPFLAVWSWTSYLAPLSLHSPPTKRKHDEGRPKGSVEDEFAQEGPARPGAPQDLPLPPAALGVLHQGGLLCTLRAECTGLLKDKGDTPKFLPFKCLILCGWISSQ